MFAGPSTGQPACAAAALRHDREARGRAVTSTSSRSAIAIRRELALLYEGLGVSAVISRAFGSVFVPYFGSQPGLSRTRTCSRKTMPSCSSATAAKLIDAWHLRAAGWNLKRSHVSYAHQSHHVDELIEADGGRVAAVSRGADPLNCGPLAPIGSGCFDRTGPARGRAPLALRLTRASGADDQAPPDRSGGHARHALPHSAGLQVGPARARLARRRSLEELPVAVAASQVGSHIDAGFLRLSPLPDTEGRPPRTCRTTLRPQARRRRTRAAARSSQPCARRETLAAPAARWCCALRLGPAVLGTKVQAIDDAADRARAAASLGTRGGHPATRSRGRGGRSGSRSRRPWRGGAGPASSACCPHGRETSRSTGALRARATGSPGCFASRSSAGDAASGQRAALEDRGRQPRRDLVQRRGATCADRRPGLRVTISAPMVRSATTTKGPTSYARTRRPGLDGGPASASRSDRSRRARYTSATAPPDLSQDRIAN